MAKPISGAKTLIDPQDGVALRTFFEALRAQLASDRSTWDGQWQQLASTFEPYGARFNYSQANTGYRQDYSIINETGILAKRTLAAGMLNGMSPPTRPWFKIIAADPAVNELKAVRVWCEDTEQRLRTVFLKSNFYQTMLGLYGEQGLYGTSAFFIEEDPQTVIRCRPLPVGEYYLGCDDTLRVDLCIRVVSMTIRQIVERFGYDNCSSAVQVQYDSPAGGVKETRLPVVHALTNGSYFDPKSYTPPMAWVSTWYEMGSFNEKTGILRRSGFNECPLVAGRWRVIGEDTYGRSPAMDCLGSTMSLQAWEMRLAEAAERQFNPPMVASSEVDPRKITTLPGETIFADTRDVRGAYGPAYTFQFNLEHGQSMLNRIEQRINDAMYRSIFQMFSDSDRREITAAEIAAKQQEKLQLLGPVVERNTEEVLAPSVVRTLGILNRRGMLATMPDELKRSPLKLEFSSILAQAQRIGEVTGLAQFIGFIGGQVAVDPTVLDPIDMDQVVRTAAILGDIPAKILRSPEEVKAIRQNRAQQQAQAAAAENAQKLAAAGKNMSETEMGTDSLLDRALPELTRITGG